MYAALAGTRSFSAAMTMMNGPTFCSKPACRGIRSWRAFSKQNTTKGRRPFSITEGGHMNCKELTVERLLVRDPAGRGTVAITGTEVVLCDERQDPRLILRLDPDHCPSIHLLDAIRTARIQLQVRPNGAAS